MNAPLLLSISPTTRLAKSRRPSTAFVAGQRSTTPACWNYWTRRSSRNDDSPRRSRNGACRQEGRPSGRADLGSIPGAPVRVQVRAEGRGGGVTLDRQSSQDGNRPGQGADVPRAGDWQELDPADRAPYLRAAFTP